MNFTSSLVKPGFCPPVPKDSVGVCVEYCSSDDTCPGEQKCCSNGCGHFCSVPTGGVIPRPVKPGFCPPVPKDSVGVCVDECSSDDTCPGEQKCCSNCCGHFCSVPTGGVIPRPVKPGFCPPVPKDKYSVCVEYCSSDDTCPSEQKCCSNGWGHFCSVPTGGVIPRPARCQVGKPLPHIFCGRGSYRQKCPRGYYCNNDRGDRFAVCCQRRYS
ncbi:WFDC3 [Mytilus edulis]|uniref:WFDC3 n=1 Tax=Mytilus edulis TaxID=6550 RepID=A0A8S3ST48_MYTED|nr:WFDC3 [Mytilus edulis]